MGVQSVLVLMAMLLMAAGLPSQAGNTMGLSENFFPIMPWEGLRAGWDKAVNGCKSALESVAECNFTVAGFVQPKDLPVCEKLGLKAIVAPPVGGGPWKKKWGDVSDELIDSSIRRWVQDAGGSSAIMGYYIVDEPGTAKFPALGKAVAAVGKYAPKKLAYINLFPGYATIGAPDQSQLGAPSFTDYLEEFVALVKPGILSYDNYKVVYSDNLQSREQGASYFNDLVEVRRISLKYGIPFWNTVCSNRIRPYTTVPSPANLLLQAYTTLAAGGRGLAWYLYYKHGYDNGPVDESGNRTDTWYYLQMVNRQVKVLGPIMNRMKSTGVFFTDPQPADGLPSLPGRMVKSVDSRASLQGHSNDSPPLMVGEFEGQDGHGYVMLVNLSLEKSVNFTLHTQETYAQKKIISAWDGKPMPMEEANGQWLVPGQGVLIRLAKSETR